MLVFDSYKIEQIAASSVTSPQWICVQRIVHILTKHPVGNLSYNFNGATARKGNWGLEPNCADQNLRTQLHGIGQVGLQHAKASSPLLAVRWPKLKDCPYIFLEQNLPLLRMQSYYCRQTHCNTKTESQEHGLSKVPVLLWVTCLSIGRRSKQSTNQSLENMASFSLKYLKSLVERHIREKALKTH